MKKSKPSSSSKRKGRSRSPRDSKSKRIKHRSKSSEKDKIKKEDKSGPRKTRWQAVDTKDISKNAPVSAEAETKKEKSGPPPRIRDFLHDKEKIVDLLFQTVTGAALKELIPDYLKNRSEEEIKKLCLGQIKDMTNEDILQIISGKVDSSNKDVEKEQVLKPEQPSHSLEKDEKKEVRDTGIKEVSSKELPSDKSEAPKTDSSEKEITLEEENLIPLVIKDEIAKDLIEPERDAELLELEMRARAIRSLLKSKAQSGNEIEMD